MKIQSHFPGKLLGNKWQIQAVLPRTGSREISCSSLDQYLFSVTSPELQVLICWTSSHITELQNEGWIRVVCAVALVFAAFWLL